ncbi:hypothetical protein EDB89DRAFT_1901307 [Lactarius sanguifluus]|nr:hypothetical protein EDB89DRAFT_1901307 [Lactarius sanguifluus]
MPRTPPFSSRPIPRTLTKFSGMGSGRVLLAISSTVQRHLRDGRDVRKFRRARGMAKHHSISGLKASSSLLEKPEDLITPEEMSVLSLLSLFDCPHAWEVVLANEFSQYHISRRVFPASVCPFSPGVLALWKNAKISICTLSFRATTPSGYPVIPIILVAMTSPSLYYIVKLSKSSAHQIKRWSGSSLILILFLLPIQIRLENWTPQLLRVAE